MISVRIGVVIAILGLAALVSCGGESSTPANTCQPKPADTAAIAQPGPALVPGDHSASGFSLGVMPASFLGDEPTGEFSVSEERLGDELLVTISIAGANNLRALYGRLHYDPQRFTPVAVEQLPLVGHTSADIAEDHLVLSITNVAGIVDFGQVLANCDNRPGLNGDAKLARVRFNLEAFNGTVRESSAVPLSDEEQPGFTLDLTNRRARWSYFMLGDYNQDGLVNLTDLTPFGVHYGKEALKWHGFPPGSIQWVIDANRDGLISIQDITTIGQNYGDKVAGFNVYAHETTENRMPFSNGSQSKVPRIGGVSFSRAKGNPGTEQLWFDVDDDFLLDGQYHWVRPTDGVDEGTPSNAALMASSVADTFTFSVREETDFFGGSYESIRFEVGNNGVNYVDVWLTGAQGLEQCAVQIDFDPALVHPEHYRVRMPEPADHLPLALFDEEYGYTPGSAAVFIHGFNNAFEAGANEVKVAQLYFPDGPQDLSVFGAISAPRHTSAEAVFNTELGQLEWYYVSPGDFNQDGFVNGPDALTLQANLKEQTPFAVDSLHYHMYGYDGYDYLWFYTSVDDYRISEDSGVTGYSVYYTDDPEFFDDWFRTEYSWIMPDGATLLGRREFSAAHGNRLTDRLRFNYPIPDATAGRYYWVVPEYNDELGRVPANGIVQIPAG